MKRIADNVLYDSGSFHDWDDLNETTFLERVFLELEPMMGDDFAGYTFYVVSSEPEGGVRPDSLTDPSPRKILISLSDETSRIPYAWAPHYAAIFKSYLRWEPPDGNIFSFSVGYVRDVMPEPVRPVADRTIDVFFAGNLNHNRLALYRALHPVYSRLPSTAFRLALSASVRAHANALLPLDLSGAIPRSELTFTGGFGQGLPPAEYGRRLADSRIVLCPSGFRSAETFRHIEAMRAGAIVISEPLPATRFYRGSPIVCVENWEDGLRRVKQLLADPERLTSLQLETIAWWNDVCSEVATARYVCQTLQVIAGGGRRGRP